MGIRYINVNAATLANFFNQLDLFMEKEGWKKSRKQIFVYDRQSICRQFSKNEYRMQLWFSKSEITLFNGDDFTPIIKQRYQSATVKSSDAKGYSFRAN